MKSFSRFLCLMMVSAFLFGMMQPLLAEDSAVTSEIKATVETVQGEAAATVAAVKEQAAEESQQAEAPEEAVEQKSFMVGTFWALVPPIIAIALALITKEVYSSLFIGIVAGGLFAGSFKFHASMDQIINNGLIEAVKSGSGIFIFLVILGILVALINKSGAAAAFGEWAKKNVKTRAGAAIATFVLGLLIFIDDYFNCLTVGSVMLPVTDSKKISRAKLAYLIDATAAPVCMIAPISSWAAAVSEYAKGTQFSGLELFCRAIPYNFYSLLTFVFIICITFLHLDFGPMAKHEKNAIEKGDLFTSGNEVDNGVRPLQNANGTLMDLLFPIIILIGICVYALVYVGGIHEGKSFIDAFSETNATVALPWGGIIALVLTIIYMWLRRVMPMKEAMKSVPEGFIAMVPAILILTFAMALKNMTSALEAKEFIAAVMSNSAAGLDKFLPAVIFLVACGLAFATGTSWGTFGILIPIVTSIFPATSPLLIIGMSACLAGAVCGDHCSPISDTTIMSSAGARCEHIIHVSTQLPYAITTAAISAVSFILAGLIQNWFIVFPISVVMMVATLVIIKKATD